MRQHSGGNSSRIITLKVRGKRNNGNEDGKGCLLGVCGLSKNLVVTSSEDEVNGPISIKRVLMVSQLTDVDFFHGLEEVVSDLHNLQLDVLTC